jgi:hypothetical protein
MDSPVNKKQMALLVEINDWQGNRRIEKFLFKAIHLR